MAMVVLMDNEGQNASEGYWGTPRGGGGQLDDRMFHVSRCSCPDGSALLVMPVCDSAGPDEP